MKKKRFWNSKYSSHTKGHTESIDVTRPLQLEIHDEIR